jgi:hypothetical protein
MPMNLYMSYDLFMMYMTFHAHEFYICPMIY